MSVGYDFVIGLLTMGLIDLENESGLFKDPYKLSGILIKEERIIECIGTNLKHNIS